MSTTHLVVPGRYDRLAEITEFVAQAAGEAGLDDSAAYYCQVAVDEACTNIIMHGYEGEDRGTIDVTCTSEPGELTIVLEDQARPFDSQAVKTPDINRAFDELEIGGLGVHLMRTMMDEVDFQARASGNRLVMVKRGAGHAN